MKKILLFLIISIFALSGCGSKENADNEQEDPKIKSAATEVDKSDEDEDSSDIEINIPAEFFYDQSEEEVIALFKEDGIDNITLNDDESYTLKMPKEQHELMLMQLKSDIDADVDEIIGSMNLEYIKDVSMNDTVTELTVEIDLDLYEEDMGGLVLLDFSLHAMPYQLMNGVTEEDFDFVVVLVDSETREELDRTSVYDE